MKSSAQPQRPKTSAVKSSTIETNMMKFINQKNSAARAQGKRCNPNQQFGVSIESPDHFKGRNTLTANYGYSYKMDDNPEKTKYQYYSQQHFISLGVPPPGKAKMQRNFSNDFKKSSQTNSKAFNRQKGRLSQFIDKNGWMGNTYTVMGQERSQSARELRLVEREKTVRENQFRFTQKQKSMTPDKKRPSTHTTHKDMVQLLMAQKMKIRQSRNQLASARLGEENQRPTTSDANWGRAKSQLNIRYQKPDIELKEKEFKINFIDWGQNPFKLKNLEWNKDRNTTYEEKQVKFNPPLPAKHAAFSISDKKNSNSRLNSTAGSNRFGQTNSMINTKPFLVEN